MTLRDSILKDNALIAVFDGFKFYNDDRLTYPHGYYILETKEGNLIKDAAEFEYHSSYDWLMPVAHKLFDKIPEQEQLFAGLRLFEIGLFSELTAIFEAVIQALEYYNQQNQ